MVVKNNAATKYETTEFSLTPVSAGTTAASKVFGSGGKGTPPVGNPYAKLASGGSTSWREVFAVDATAVGSFEVETKPRFGVNGPTFTSKP